MDLMKSVIRRGWETCKLRDGELWFQANHDSKFSVKFSQEGKDILFGDSSDHSALQLPDALHFATHIQYSQEIFLSISSKEFISIVATARDPVSSLKYLAWNSSISSPVFDAIHSKKLFRLTHLVIFRNLFNFVDCEGLARSIGSGCLPSLIVLELHAVSGHLALAKVMQAGHLPLLEELTLPNSVTNSHCHAYATAFSSGKLPSLIKIDFSRNHFLGSKGVKALVLAIRSGKLKNLAHLHLSQCGVDDDGLLSLAEVLKNGHLNSLQVLDVRGCSSLSKHGATALVSALSSNPNLNVQLQFEWERFPDLERLKEQLIQRNSRYKDILAGLVDSPQVPATFGKIYLCGNPEVGKTTLRHSLQRSLWKSLLTWERRPHVEHRTRGIDVSHFSSKVSQRGEIPTTLFVWDMAGQRDYHLIHNAFLPDLGCIEGKATTFVVVCSSKSTVEESQTQLYYWLRFIASSCGKATQTRRHVMVVFNRIKGDPNVLRLAPKWTQALECLRGEFKDFLDIQTYPFIVDVRQQRSVKELKRRLLEHSVNLLRDEKVPEICQFLERNLTVWSAARRQFPVLDWTEFLTQVRETSKKPWRQEVPWREEDLRAATRYLNEAGLLIYIDKEAFSGRKLLVLDPNWFCRDIVGNMFLHQDMVDPREHLFRMEVDRSTGSISISKFKEFFNSFSKEWTPSFVEDLIAILLWLGLCYKGRPGAENIFIPSLIAESGRLEHIWGHGKAHGNNFECGEDQWVMGFSVEHDKNERTLAPITLWHRFQVELAQTTRFNGRPDNDFVCGRSSMTFSADHMAVFIEVTANQGIPTFDDINIFVKPLLADDHLDGNHRKQCQVDLASELVEIFLKLWNEVCPGVEYLHRVIWPWPASSPGLHVAAERNVDVEDVKKWVKEHGLGWKMQWMVGSSNTITEDQLLSSKHKLGVNKSVERSLQIVNQILEEAVALGIYPPDVLIKKGSGEALNLASDGMEEPSLPRSTTGKFLAQRIERLEEKMDKKLDNLQDLSREILMNQKRLRQKVQDVGDIFLQDKERSCPRFMYLGEKNSGAWVPLKEALSTSRSFRLHFACEARYDDYGQHAVQDQHGLEVSHLKEWAKTVVPWVKVSLTVLYISAKVAANVVVPGLGLVLPNFGDWQQASSLSEALAGATGFSSKALNDLVEGMGVDASGANLDPREIYGKCRVAMTKILGKMTAQAYKEKLGLRKVCLYYGDGSLHGIAWICYECCEKFRSSGITMTEL